MCAVVCFVRPICTERIYSVRMLVALKFSLLHFFVANNLVICDMKRHVSLPILVVLAALCVYGSSAVTFTPLPGDKKCFSEELRAAARYELRYKMARSLTTFVSVSVTGPQSSKMFSHSVARSDTIEWFTTHDAGEYTVCFNVNKKAASITASLDITFHIQDEQEANLQRQRREVRDNRKTQKTQTSPAFAQAAYIESTIEAIHRDYLYLKQREEDMRNTNEDTNTRTWALTVVTIVIVVAVTGLRHLRLKRFLQKKKILD